MEYNTVKLKSIRNKVIVNFYNLCEVLERLESALNDASFEKSMRIFDDITTVENLLNEIQRKGLN